MRETPSPVIHEAPNTSWTHLFVSAEHRRGYIISVALGSLLAVSGAFETQDLPLWARFAYWLPVMLAGAFIGGLISWKLVAIERWARSPLLSWAVVTVLVAIPMTFIVWAVTGLAFQGHVKLAHLPFFFPTVTLVSAFMSGILTFTNQAPRETHGAPSPQNADDAPPQVRFRERLPIALRGAEIYAVSSEDHYLRIHSSRGTDLILMRLSDAIGELDGIEGAQVHRSWWVARAAVKDVERGDGKAVFTLINDTQVPVSRTYAKALREIGWY
ncbi:LytTR family DNA-binding domain-containing protein [Aquidulcibacter paucihalophilus]|uniref:LytTR family DNA-binding domain-containing protein n=1 Tax=Aquidulcibacter paucihalophilus TaxID=1978549 RepID=UPI000A18E9D0|nr:LytTR family DNA-binding domain-containing protein [Aquidulcibacter paucihalophilus]